LDSIGIKFLWSFVKQGVSDEKIEKGPSNDRGTMELFIIKSIKPLYNENSVFTGSQ
jgi:hypothetical protein